MSVKAVTNGGRMRITEVNPHLICALCGGYLIDATTIVECLHSFCKTCIMRYLETSKYCPICEVLIHKTRPWQNIRLDETLQNIVYKVVPGLFQREMKRRREYYDNQPVPSKSSGKARTSNRIIFAADEDFSISLEFWPEGPNSMETDCQNKICDKLHDRRYLLCPAAVNMSHLKRFIRNKFSLSDRYQIDIYHTNQPLSDHFTLIDVAYIYSWRREGILRLFYAFYLNESKKMKVDDIRKIKPEVEDIKHVLEPVNACNDVIFENKISIIESEKKPVVTPGRILTNSEGNRQYQQPSTSPQDVATDLSKPFVKNSDIPPKSTLITNNHDTNTHDDDVVIFDDDDEDERQMQIVMEEVEIEDSESNLEIVIDDEPETKASTVPATQLDVSTQSTSDTKSDVLNVPSVKPSLTINNNVNEPSMSDKSSNLQTKPKQKPNHFEAVQKYVNSQLPQSPSKDAQSQTVAPTMEPEFKEPSHHITKPMVKDTGSQVIMSRPPPSPVKDMTFRYPSAKLDKKEVTMKHIVASPKSPTRLLITSKDIFPRSSNSSVKEMPSNHSSKKDRHSSEKSSLVATKSTKKDSPHRLILSIHKDTSGKTTSNNKDTARLNTSQSYVASYTMKSSTKETLSRPLTSSKKEPAIHPPSSPTKEKTTSLKVSSTLNKTSTSSSKLPSSPAKVSSQSQTNVTSTQIKVPQSPTQISSSPLKVLSSPKIPTSPSKMTSSQNKVPINQNKIASSSTRVPSSPNKSSPSPNRTSPSPSRMASGATTPTINRVPTPTSVSTSPGKDLTTKISSNTVKDTAAQVGKPNHKDSNSHSYSAKSLPGVTAHIKHVPQVPRLVKAPITQLKPQSSEAYRHLPHNMIPKWQPHLNNGYYKPPQESPLELKREAVPIDYSKPS